MTGFYGTLGLVPGFILGHMHYATMAHPENRGRVWQGRIVKPEPKIVLIRRYSLFCTSFGASYAIGSEAYSMLRPNDKELSPAAGFSLAAASTGVLQGNPGAAAFRAAWAGVFAVIGVKFGRYLFPSEEYNQRLQFYKF